MQVYITQSDKESSLSMSSLADDDVKLETSFLEADYVDKASNVMVTFWRRKFEQQQEKNQQLEHELALRISAYHTLRNDAIQCLENERNSLTMYYQSKYNILSNFYTSRIRRIYNALNTNSIAKKITNLKPGVDHGCANYTVCVVPECEFNTEHDNTSFCSLHCTTDDLMRHEVSSLEELRP